MGTDYDALLQAVESGNYDQAKSLLAQGADPNAIPEDSDGPLHWAAMFGRMALVKLLVEHNASVNTPGSYGRTPLMYAAADGSSVEMLDFLLNCGADINATHDGGDNALFDLITRDHASPDVARLLIERGLDIHALHESHNTALCWAAFCGRTAIVELLLQEGARVNDCKAGGASAIVQAMHRGHHEIVKLLFARGADADSAGTFGDSLLEYAAESNDPDFVKAVNQRLNPPEQPPSTPNPEALLSAARKGDIAILALLFEEGYSVDLLGAGTETALIKAAAYGKTDAVEYLLDRGADIIARDSRGNTALLHAAYFGRTETVALLLDRGAEINERNKLNWNALMQACADGHYKTAELLIKRGSPLDEIDAERGATALQLAEHRGANQLAELLRSHGADYRPIRYREPDEPYRSILDCDVCAYMRQQMDLGKMYEPDRFLGLELVYQKVEHSDRYCDDTTMIKRCTICGTCYLHYHSLDTEDAWISGPWISQNIQRLPLLQLEATLASVEKTAELDQARARYPEVIHDYRAAVTGGRQIGPNVRPQVIGSLVDEFIATTDWAGLKALLEHPDPLIALPTADTILTIFAERPSTGHFPHYRRFRSFTTDIQRQLKALLKRRRRVVERRLARFADHPEETIRQRHEQFLEYARASGFLKKPAASS